MKSLMTVSEFGKKLAWTRRSNQDPPSTSIKMLQFEPEAGSMSFWQKVEKVLLKVFWNIIICSKVPSLAEPTLSQVRFFNKIIVEEVHRIMFLYIFLILNSKSQYNTCVLKIIVECHWNTLIFECEYFPCKQYLFWIPHHQNLRPISLWSNFWKLASLEQRQLLWLVCLGSRTRD